MKTLIDTKLKKSTQIKTKKIPSGHQTCTKQAQTQTKTKQTPIEKNFDKQTNRHQTKDTQLNTQNRHETK